MPTIHAGDFGEMVGKAQERLCPPYEAVTLFHIVRQADMIL
jgi:hypothetical protein